MQYGSGLFNKLDNFDYPKYWFLSFIAGVLSLIVILDIVAYKTFNNIQRNRSNNLLTASFQQLHKDIEHIEYTFLRLSHSEINNKAANQLQTYLTADFFAYKAKAQQSYQQENNLFSVVKFNESSPNETNANQNSQSYQGKTYGKDLVYTDKLQLLLTRSLENTNSDQNIQLGINIEPLIKNALKLNDASKYKNFILVFKATLDNQVGYVQTAQSKYIENLNGNPLTLFDESNLRKLSSVNIFSNKTAVVDIYLKQAALQEFLRLLMLISILVSMIALLTAYYLYEKFYGLKKYNLRLNKDKNLFQQQAEVTLASVHDGVILTNSTSQIVYINSAIERFLKLKTSAVYFKTVSEIIPELNLLENLGEQHFKLNDFKLVLNQQNCYFDVQAIKLYNEQDGYIGNAICLHDITDKKSAQQRINYLAYNDDLTALGNKQALLDYYSKNIGENSGFENDHKHKLLTIVIDIQSLKNINDTIGYENGEQTLLSVIKILRECLADNNLKNNLYRISEDVLAIAYVYDAEVDKKSAMQYTTDLISKLIHELNKPIVIAQQNIYLQYTFGVSIYPDNFVENFDAWLAILDFAVLLRYAEIAMSAARREGPGKFVFYSEGINLSIKEKFHLENELRNAVRENELELLFHPQVNIQSGKLRGFEVLVRWIRNDDRVISPGTFIPLLEKSGLIVTVGDWILREACLQGLQLINDGVEFQTLSVNISGIQLQTENFIERLKNILLETNFPKEKLELEITESVFFDNPKLIISILHSLRSDGIEIALDDFGTGFSSLTYLKNLPLDCLKIDKEFVKEIATGDTRLLEAILAIAKTMNLTSVAEGVETLQEVDFLRKHMCDIIQGYYICKPLSVAAVITKFGSDFKL